MTFSSGSNWRGTRCLATLLGAVALLVSTAAMSQQTTNVAANPDVFKFFVESQFQKTLTQVTPEERAAAMEQLTNLYSVASLPRAKELSAEPRINAQIELQRMAILYNAFAADYLSKNVASDQEIFDMYQEQVVLAPPTEFKARHILVDTQSEALELIEQLQDGADFVELAKEHSTGPSAQSGGDLGWFGEQAMVKPFSEAVTAMEDGAFTSAPVQTQFGWHVILREDSRDSSPPPLDSVRDVIKQRIEQQKFQDFLISLRSSTSE